MAITNAITASKADEVVSSYGWSILLRNVYYTTPSYLSGQSRPLFGNHANLRLAIWRQDFELDVPAKAKRHAGAFDPQHGVALVVFDGKWRAANGPLKKKNDNQVD